MYRLHFDIAGGWERNQSCRGDGLARAAWPQEGAVAWHLDNRQRREEAHSRTAHHQHDHVNTLLTEPRAAHLPGSSALLLHRRTDPEMLL